MISLTKNEEIWSGIDERVMQWQNRQSRRKPGISLGLRKFRRDYENFAIIAKISQS